MCGFLLHTFKQIDILFVSLVASHLVDKILNPLVLDILLSLNHNIMVRLGLDLLIKVGSLDVDFALLL